jgi:iron complex outermembrane receptor protein
MNSIRNPKLRGALWCATAGFAATLAGEALAQATLDEITVTARRREESVQDIPVVVTAFTADELARRGVNELEDIAAATPGLAFEDFSNGFSAAPVIRGLTQVNVSSEVQNVATFIDGIYMQRNFSVDIGQADLERIEVVKGPQSALYGQNAFAGAINYVLAKPGDEVAGYGEVTGGSDGRLDYRFAVGGPVIDGKLGLRASYGSSEFDGTWRNEFPGLSDNDARLGWYDNENYSLIAVATPVDWMTAELSYMKVDRRLGNRPGYSINTGDLQNTGNCGPRVGTTTRLSLICGELSNNPGAYQSAASTRPAGAINVQLNAPGFTNETDFWHAKLTFEFGDSFELNYDYGNVDAKGQEISAPNVNPVSPSVGVNLVSLAMGVAQFGVFNNLQKQGSSNLFESHELRLDYRPQGSPLQATVGYFRSDFDDFYRFFQTSVPPGVQGTDTTSGFLDMTGFPFGLRDLVNTGTVDAWFGTVSYTFFEKLTVGAELRYSEEKKGLRDVRAAVTLADQFDDWIPRFTVDYKLNDAVMLYASAAKGLKTGSFNGVRAGTVTIPPEEQAVGPESNLTSEIGVKSTLLDGRMVLNAAVFNVDWNDLQIQALPSNTPANLVDNTPVIFRNLGNARSRGLEVQTLFAATDKLSFNLAASFTQPEFEDGTRSFRFNNRCDDVVCPRNTEVGGKTLPRTPKTQVSAGAEWASTTGNGFEYFLRGDMTYQSEMQVEEMNLAQIPPRTLVNVRAGIGRDGWSADVWGRNVLGEKYVANSFFIIQGVSYGATFGELATYGATMRYRF